MLNSKKNNSMWLNVALNFSLFSGKQPELQGFSTTYFVLARRADHYIVNPLAMADMFNRIFILLKNMRADNPDYSKWVFALSPKFAPLARWFGWSTKSSIYAMVDRTLGIISKEGMIYSVTGILACYTFMNFVGVDLAFVLCSKSSSGRATLLTRKSLLTIGFDGHETPNYGYNMPGTRTIKSALMYSRLFSILLSRWGL